MRAYEPHIAIRYDEVSRLASVNIHGLEIFLQDRYPTRALAVQAGEAFCRHHALLEAPRVNSGAAEAA